MKFSQEAFDRQNAADVVAYWHNLGYRNVTCEVVPRSVQVPRTDDKKEMRTIWELRSNLINGVPSGVDPYAVCIPDWERKPLRESSGTPLQWPARSLLRPARPTRRRA